MGPTRGWEGPSEVTRKDGAGIPLGSGVGFRAGGGGRLARTEVS